jgi:hypothetical protein
MVPSHWIHNNMDLRKDQGNYGHMWYWKNTWGMDL